MGSKKLSLILSEFSILKVYKTVKKLLSRNTIPNLDLFQKIIFTIVIIFFILGTETSQFLQLFLFILFIFLYSLKKHKFSANLVFGIFIFPLIWSRFWYTIHIREPFLLYALKDNNLSDFLAQRYFQFQGP
ncbi:hypothetical protein CHRY9393_02348 [Chryseobacterium fistulae]|uniref:Uncharacterized protein n=1 Tax=Chryseobacterium fistulae TaxID=2675058 RepID=A0A6N4XWB7_9FLAO|nr:hypothetical protein CHRY9393_02348 [Chryseobacterium fistulae]